MVVSPIIAHDAKHQQWRTMVTKNNNRNFNNKFTNYRYKQINSKTSEHENNHDNSKPNSRCKYQNNDQPTRSDMYPTCTHHRYQSDERGQRRSTHTHWTTNQTAYQDKKHTQYYNHSQRKDPHRRHGDDAYERQQNRKPNNNDYTRNSKPKNQTKPKEKADQPNSNGILKKNSTNTPQKKKKTVKIATNKNIVKLFDNSKPPQQISKKAHRGIRNKQNRKWKKLKILTVNTRGIKSKLTSLESTLKATGTHIAGITETHLNAGETINIPGYEWVHTPRTTTTGGGTGILIRNDIKNKTETITPDTPNTESTWLKINTKTPIFVGIVYGKQENNQIEETENQYQELITTINQLKKEGNIILMGDFNAKITVMKEDCQQQASRNGKLLENLLKLTNTTAINTTKKHTGTWTRENRNKADEKSVIDYIIMDKTTEKSITESETDNSNKYPIEGKNRTDHNIISATIQINETVTSTKLTKWKQQPKQKWTEYNKEVQKEWSQLEANQQTYPNLEIIITKALEKHIGKQTISINKKDKVTNDKIKEAKSKRKKLKQEYNEVCKTRDYPEIQQKKQEYINQQIATNKLIQEELKQRTKKTINRIIQEGGTNSSSFWKIRKQILGKGNKEEYNTVTEDGTTLTSPTETKNHIAGYFEDLYQARQGEESHREWTEKINNEVNRIANRNDDHTQTITAKETEKAIKQLRKNKSTGPDQIPNKAFIEADQQTTQIITKAMNNIYETEDIPQSWQEGEILRIYKGKGKKGKCSNERGITLSSNAGKLFERIINNRITQKIKITEAQAGGQKGKATADHLTIINNIIKQTKRKKKDKKLYIALLDVTKAYDKAWLNAILYALHKSGIDGKEWRITRNLNQNLTATIKTKHGNTRKINIKDSIRQGGVLSVVEYANLIDEISKEIAVKGIGNIKVGQNNIPGCLLWMDDVALIHHNKDELQEMLNVTEDISKRYHIKFGKEKSQVLTIGQKAGKAFNLGSMELDDTNTYKYLGVTINHMGTMEDHIKKLKGKAEAALQTIFNVSGNQNFHGIEMEIIWKLVKTCINPIIMYAAEIWTPTKHEIQQIQKIHDNLLKRILLCPQSTPRECVLLETGLWDVETMMHEKQIMYLQKIMKSNDSNTKKISLDPTTTWNKQIVKILQKYDITTNQIEQTSKEQLKKIIKNKITAENITRIKAAGQKKSKVNHLLSYKTEDTIYRQPRYIKDLQRKEAAAVFTLRARMLKTKANYPNMYQDKKCRWCSEDNETQEHIINQCPRFEATTDRTQIGLQYTNIMENETDSLKIEAIIISKIEEIIKEAN